MTGDATDAKVSVTWAEVEGAKSYVVRWGENADGQLDNHMMVVKAPTVAADITENIPAVGKSIDIYVQAFNSDFATPDEAMRSQEYDPNNWSELVTAEIVAAPAPDEPEE